MKKRGFSETLTFAILIGLIFITSALATEIVIPKFQQLKNDARYGGLSTLGIIYNDTTKLITIYGLDGKFNLKRIKVYMTEKGINIPICVKEFPYDWVRNYTINISEEFGDCITNLTNPIVCVSYASISKCFIVTP